MTLTLELPDDLAARIENIPLEQRNRFAVAALSMGMDQMALREEGDPDPEAVAAIHRAVEMGLDKSVSLDEFARSRGISLK